MAEQAPGTREKRGSTTKILQGLGHPCCGARLGEQVFRAIAWFIGDGYTLMSFNEVLHSVWVVPILHIGLRPKLGTTKPLRLRVLPACITPCMVLGTGDNACASLFSPPLS